MEFLTPTISDLRFAIDLNANGTIAMDGETAASQKNFTVKNFKTAGTEEGTLNNYTNANNLIARLMSIVLGTYSTSDMRQTIVRKLGEE